MGKSNNSNYFLVKKVLSQNGMELIEHKTYKGNRYGQPNRYNVINRSNNKVVVAKVTIKELVKWLVMLEAIEFIEEE